MASPNDPNVPISPWEEPQTKKEKGGRIYEREAGELSPVDEIISANCLVPMNYMKGVISFFTGPWFISSWMQGLGKGKSGTVSGIHGTHDPTSISTECLQGCTSG